MLYGRIDALVGGTLNATVDDEFAALPADTRALSRIGFLIYRWRGQGPWKALGDGLPQPLDSFVHALATVPGALFAALGDGRIYVSLDGGDTWRPLPLQGEPLRHLRALACAA